MKLLFVYNADGSFGATLRDTLKKVVTPNAQECSLCALTYPHFAMDSAWREFTRSLPYPVLFLHRYEFRSQYPSQKETLLPAVFSEENGTLRLFISREAIDRTHTVRELIALVRESLIVSILTVVAEAHHGAFAQTQGVDPSWALWYAERLVADPAFTSAVAHRFKPDELAAILTELDASFSTQHEESSWERFYATLLMQVRT